MAVVIQSAEPERFYPQTNDCRICGIHFKNPTCHLKHMRRVHGDTVSDGSLHCSKCKRIFKVTQHKEAHLGKHNDSTDIKCTSCSCKFINLQDYCQHIMKLHCKGTRCPKCCVMFARKLELKKHLLVLDCQAFKSELEKSGRKFVALGETPKDKYTCEHCSKTFTKIGHLKAHVDHVHTGMRRTVNEELLTCEFCNKKCTSKSQLTIHLRIHTGSRPFRCPHCDRGFAIKGNLTVHVKRWHNGQPKYKCHQQAEKKQWLKYEGDFGMFQLEKPIPCSLENPNDSVFVKFRQKETCAVERPAVSSVIKSSSTENLHNLTKKTPIKTLTETDDSYILLNLESNQFAFDTSENIIEHIPQIQSENTINFCKTTSNLVTPQPQTFSQLSKLPIGSVENIDPIQLKESLTSSKLLDTDVSICDRNDAPSTVNSVTFEKNANKTSNTVIAALSEQQEILKVQNISSPPTIPFNPIDSDSSNTIQMTDEEQLTNGSEFLRRLSFDKDLDDSNLNFTTFPLDHTIPNLSHINFNDLYGDLINKNTLLDADWLNNVSQAENGNSLVYANDDVTEYSQCDPIYSEEELLIVQKRYLNNTPTVISFHTENTPSITHTETSSCENTTSHTNTYTTTDLDHNEFAQSQSHSETSCSETAASYTHTHAIVSKESVTSNQQHVIVFNNSQIKSNNKSNVIVKNRYRDNDIDLYQSNRDEATLADSWLNEFHSPCKTMRSAYSQGTVLKNISDGEITDIMTSLL